MLTVHLGAPANCNNCGDTLFSSVVKSAGVSVCLCTGLPVGTPRNTARDDDDALGRRDAAAIGKVLAESAALAASPALAALPAGATDEAAGGATMLLAVDVCAPAPTAAASAATSA